MVYIGIDPGKSGAMAIISGDDIVVYPYDERLYLPALRLCGNYDYDNPSARCVLEHVGARPGQGVTSMFTFGEYFGWVKGVLEVLRIPYELVRPAKWKKEFSVTADKNSSIEVARRLFPNVSLRRTDKCRTDDDNMAEALLMAEYARRHL